MEILKFEIIYTKYLVFYTFLWLTGTWTKRKTYAEKEEKRKIFISGHLQANISSLAFFNDPRYVEAAAELQPSSHAQTQAFSMRPIQTHLFQLPGQQWAYRDEDTWSYE